MLMEITTTDRILRELGIIDAIFKAQFYTYDVNDEMNYVCDRNGMDGCNGRYIHMMDIYSNVELLNLQLYKKEITARYETANRTDILFGYLNNIRELALKLRNYFNDNFTRESIIVKKYLEEESQLSNEERMDFHETHNAIITVWDYSIGEVYFGCSRSSGNYTGLLNRYELSYIGYNSTLALFCQELITFINRILSEKQTANALETKFTSPQLLHIFNILKSKKIVGTRDREPFLGIFSNYSGLVHWNEDAERGAKAGLFDLMERLTGINQRASVLKKYFECNSQIHDNWKGKKKSRLIDEIMEDV